MTWSQLPSTNPASNGDWYYVNRIALQPGNPNVILAATRYGVYRSTDGGASWTKTFSTTRAGDVKFDPLDGSKALVAPDYAGGAVHYSTDGGVTWTASNLNTGYRIEVAYARTSGVVYAGADNGAGGNVYRSSDGGKTWTVRTRPNGTSGHLGSQGWYDNALWVDRVNSNHVIVGGIDLWRSLDGGGSWSQLSVCYQVDSGSVHADHHTIVAHPAYDGSGNRTVYFGNDGGVYRAQDISSVTTTSGWTKLNNGLGITQFYGGAGHNGTNGRIIGGTQDNGSLLYTGSGTTWRAHYGGDGGFSAVDPTDGNYIYGEYVYLQIHRSTNGGATNSSSIYSGIADAGSGTTSNFISPFTLDVLNPNVMYAGGQSLWRSTNVKGSPVAWSKVYDGAGSGTKISQIAVSLVSSDLVWVGRNNGTVLKSVNATATTPTWTSVGVGALPARTVLAVLPDKSDVNTVYVGFGGYSSANLWRSRDGGSTWTSIGTALPPSPVRTIERHPTDPLTLYVGTEVGIFTSGDGGATWSTTNDGPANTSVEKLFWLDAGNLVASTHGRGMFKTTIGSVGTSVLTVTKSGTGSGTVTSSPAGISCGSTCSASYASGTTVTLTAAAASGSTFAGWSGACSGTGICTVTLSAAQNVTATFNPVPVSYTLSVAKAGTGSGTVTSSPAGINCGSTCSASYLSGTSVTLTAAPVTGSTFAGWTGACTGTGTCTVTMSAAKNVTATFSPVTYVLTVTKAGTGSGTVTSSPAGINCGSTCSASYNAGTAVTLTAKSASGSTFAGWSGACTGTKTCKVTMSTANSVAATFNRR